MSILYEMNLAYKTPVLFGIGAAEKVGIKAKEFGCGKIFLVTDKGVKATGMVDKIETYLKNQGLEVYVFDDVVSDPPDTKIDESAAVFKKEKCDGIVAIGGGSSLDTGKCLKKMSRNEGKAAEFCLDFNLGTTPGVPLITMPTTSGTGAEVSTGAVVTLTEFGIKGGMTNLIPDLAIIDPVLCSGMPSYITAATGMDVLAHVVEEILTISHNLNMDVLACHAVKLVYKSLKKAVENGSDLDARSDMCYAAYIGGVGICEVMLSFGHASAHTIGARKHLMHGALVALTTPGTIRILGPHLPDKMKLLAEAMEIPFDEKTSNDELVKKCSDRVIALRKSIGLKNFKELGLTMEDLDELTDHILDDIMMNFCCCDVTKQDIMKFFKEDYEA